MRRVLVVCLSVCFALLSTGLAAAGALEDGLAAYERGEYGAAIMLLRPLAVQGNPDARYSMGRIYEYGRGVEQNSQLAVEWYELAAGSGHVQAQNDLGVMYTLGRGVPRNPAKALQWYRQAAGKGLAIAQ